MTCSGDEKVTAALLKVDLQCCQCYKKIKRTLCRFPQIRDQVYDEKQNTVSITIVCCSPERILDKLCAKAGKSIKSVHIKPPPSQQKPPSDQPKPTPTPTPKPAADPAPKPAADPEKPKPKPKPAPEAQPLAPAPAPAPVSDNKPPKKKPDSAPDPAPAPAPKAAEEPPKAAEAPQPMPPAQLTEPLAQWVPGYPPGPPPQVYPVSMYCAPSYDAAYYPSYGRPPCHPPPPCYAANRCDYFSEENPSACSVM
ncbi:hypothetical protein vseg_011607 [Gypsophila vaccaria]